MHLLNTCKHTQAMRWKGHPYFFRLVGKTVENHKKDFKLRTNTMKKYFAQFFEIDARCVEFNQLYQVEEGGLEYNFTIYSRENEKLNARVNRLLKIYNSVCNDEDQAFVQGIIDKWNLNPDNGEKEMVLDINVTNITTYYQINLPQQEEEFKQDMTLIKKSEHYYSNKNLYSFANGGIYQSIRIETKIFKSPTSRKQSDDSKDSDLSMFRVNVASAIKNSINHHVRAINDRESESHSQSRDHSSSENTPTTDNNTNQHSFNYNKKNPSRKFVKPKNLFKFKNASMNNVDSGSSVMNSKSKNTASIEKRKDSKDSKDNEYGKNENAYPNLTKNLNDINVRKENFAFDEDKLVVILDGEVNKDDENDHNKRHATGNATKLHKTKTHTKIQMSDLKCDIPDEKTIDNDDNEQKSKTLHLKPNSKRSNSTSVKVLPSVSKTEQKIEVNVNTENLNVNKAVKNLTDGQPDESSKSLSEINIRNLLTGTGDEENGNVVTSIFGRNNINSGSDNSDSSFDSDSSNESKNEGNNTDDEHEASIVIITTPKSDVVTPVMNGLPFNRASLGSNFSSLNINSLKPIDSSGTNLHLNLQLNDYRSDSRSRSPSGLYPQFPHTPTSMEIKHTTKKYHFDLSDVDQVNIRIETPKGSRKQSVQRKRDFLRQVGTMSPNLNNNNTSTNRWFWR